MYSHENYMKNRTSIRKSQKKYYNKNKAKICSKYAHIRRAWDKANKAYLNEHARLNKQIKKLESVPYTNTIEKLLNNVYAYKEYLSDLYSRGLI